MCGSNTCRDDVAKLSVQRVEENLAVKGWMRNRGETTRDRSLDEFGMVGWGPMLIF